MTPEECLSRQTRPHPSLSWVRPDQWHQPPAEGALTYVFYAPVTRQFKVGMTEAPRKRWSGIRTAAGLDLRYLGGVAGFEYDDGEASHHVVEDFIHERLTQWRTIGEWFHFSEPSFDALVLTFAEVGGTRYLEDPGGRTVYSYDAYRDFEVPVSQRPHLREVLT